MVFIYLQKGQRRKKNKKTIDLLGEQGVNWSAITKQRQASTHKEWEEVGRQMDWVTTGHKGEAGTKWTVPIMLRLLRGNKSQRKTHLKALLPSSLIPAGGLGSTKPLAKCAWDGGVGGDTMLTRIVVWNAPRQKKKCRLLMQPWWLSMEHNRGLCCIIIGTPIRERRKTEWAGGLVARADRRCGCQKGQGTVSEGHKSWWKCLPQEAIVSTLNSTPSHHVSPPPTRNSFESFEASEGHQGPRGGWKRKQWL